MPIFIHEQETKFHVKQKRFIKKWLNALIHKHNCRCGDINIILQTDEELLSLNQSALNHDTYTDIITFNYNEGDSINGDLYISIERIKENAIKFAVSTDEELQRVMAHGVLHLLGFNDKKPNEQALMRQQENEALSLLNDLFHVKHEE